VRILAAPWFASGVLLLLASSGLPLGSAAAMAIAAGTTSLALACLAFGGALLSGRPAAERLGWSPSGLPVPVLAGLVLGLLSLSQLAEWAIAWAGYRDVGTLAEFRTAVSGVGGLELAISLLGLAILPGFGEELALRGWIQRGLAPRIGAPAAVGLASLLFALLHGEPVHASGAFLLGLYLGTVTVLSGSLRPAVLCHVVNNLLATLTVALDTQAVAGPLVVSGFLAAPWAFRRLWLQRTAAQPPLGGIPEPAARRDPVPPPR
jgi:membrane protease YdiL (CAAX protease family)